jgi:hypothetical protein
MSLTVNAGHSGGGSFEIVPAGTYAARCYQIIDLGHQTVEWQGTAKVVPKVRITWEVNEQMKDGRPYSISKEYTASIGAKSNLRKDLEAWRGRPFTEQELGAFSLENVLGAPCMIGIAHVSKGEKTFANINSIMALPKGMNCPELTNPKVKFEIENFDQDIFESLSEYVRKKILLSKEMEDGNIPTKKEEPAVEEDDSSIPF